MEDIDNDSNNNSEHEFVSEEDLGLEEAKSIFEHVDDNDSSTDNEFVSSLRDHT